MRAGAILTLATGAIVAACNSGCLSEHSDSVATPTEVAGAIELPGATEPIESADDSIGISDTTGTDFKAIWGPYTDPECVVNASVASPGTGITINATGGDYFIYVTGHFSGISPVSVPAPPAAAVIPIWPIVHTGRVKIGASGTSFMLHVNEAAQVFTVIRLRERASSGAWSGGEIEVRAESGASERIPKNLDASKAVRFDGVAGTLSAPVDLSTEERAILEEVIRRAKLQGLFVPAEAP